MSNIPSELETTRTLLMISGIMNILVIAGWIVATFFFGLGTCGIGCVIGVIPIINIVSCIMDFIAYNKVNTLTQSGTYGSINTAAILEIITVVTGNTVSMIFGIIILNYLAKDNIKSFLQQRGIY
ncbi:MAG: hypothetical protein FJ216_08555 [Ignavibacteria bacterium]|nr:hypothetical protein [Ignavibacteria bacterium]